MNIVINPKGIVDRAHPGQGVMDTRAGGFSEMVLDMSLACPPYELEIAGKMEEGEQKGRQKEDDSMAQSMEPLMSQSMEPLLASSMEPLLAKSREVNVTCPIGAVPRLNRDTKRKDLNGLLEKLARESIRICGQAGCRYVVIPPLSAGIPDEEAWNVNRAFYMQLGQYAEKAGVMILLENQCMDRNGHLVRGLCSEGRLAAEWVDRLNEEAGQPLFGFSMDVGAANICGQNMYDFIVALGSRIKAVTVRDCDGNRENSLLPFTCASQGQCRTDWLNLIRGLRCIGFDGELILDMEDTAAAFSPILRPGLLKFAKSVMDYIKWQIEIEGLLKRHSLKVLFGGGNMCRNYMKTYGEKYPPLYICDNNKSLWGTVFCGLEVKSPECLKNLPPDGVIFICNIYYREIEGQLRQMGITNQIEYFNDEYMSTFYFDRLDRGGR